MGTIWKSIKRNPIILAALAILAIQVAKDWDHIQTTDYFQYLFTIAVGFLAREFTVPLREVNEKLRKQHEDSYLMGVQAGEVDEKNMGA